MLYIEYQRPSKLWLLQKVNRKVVVVVLEKTLKKETIKRPEMQITDFNIYLNPSRLGDIYTKKAATQLTTDNTIAIR